MPDTTPHRPFRDIVSAVDSAALSRRSFLGLSVAGATTVMAGENIASAAVRTPRREAATTSTLFDASFPSAHFSRYRRIFPEGVSEGRDYGMTLDSETGRQVAFMQNTRGFFLAGSAPRAAAETGDFVRPAAHGNTADVYWFGVSFKVPAASAPMGSGQWVTLAAPAYGPPYCGSSPLGIGLNPGRDRSETMLVLGGDRSLLGSDFRIPTDTWLRLVMRFRFGYEGWVQLWLDRGLTGSPRQAIPVRGRTTFAMPTMPRGVNDGWAVDPTEEANSSRVCAYGSPTRLLFGHHVVARDRAGAPILR